jgi:serine/threonine protein kinase
MRNRHDLIPYQRKVLIDDHGIARINDFALVRLIQEHGHTGMTTASSHTGTVRYLSYELVACGDDDGDDNDDPKPTTASDIWALACIGIEVGVFPHHL